MAIGGAEHERLLPSFRPMRYVLDMYYRSNATIQGTIDLQHGITACCNSCRRYQKLDLIALRDRLGPDHGALHHDLVPLLKCQSCGGRDISLLVTDDTPREEDRAHAH